MLSPNLSGSAPVRIFNQGGHPYINQIHIIHKLHAIQDLQKAASHKVCVSRTTLINLNNVIHKKKIETVLMETVQSPWINKTFCCIQRPQQRPLDKRIYNTEMKFWAVLGSRGCREKNLPTAISMQLFGVIFSTFCGQKQIQKY